MPTNPKIGVVDAQRIVDGSALGKRATEAFTKSRNARLAALEKRQDELEKANDDLIKQKGTMSADVFDTKRHELEKKYVELQQDFIKAEREFAQDRAKLTQDILSQAQTKIAALAKAEGVTVILDKQSSVWNDPATDLTARLLLDLQ